MSTVPNLLNDDGSASIATALMMSHHGFRRDLARFARALDTIERGERARTDAVREEWQNYRATLHGHHEVEDGAVFPMLAAEHASARATIERLSVDHRRIDPLLERSDAAFRELPKTESASAIVAELSALLDAHLALEESEIVGFLRGAKAFPPPATDAEADMYAQGFAWAMQGIAPDVLEQLLLILPENVRSRLPSARASFDERCRRAWGSAKAGSARTPIPDGL